MSPSPLCKIQCHAHSACIVFKLKETVSFIIYFAPCRFFLYKFIAYLLKVFSLALP